MKCLKKTLITLLLLWVTIASLGLFGDDKGVMALGVGSSLSVVKLSINDVKDASNISCDYIFNFNHKTLIYKSVSVVLNNAPEDNEDVFLRDSEDPPLLLLSNSKREKRVFFIANRKDYFLLIERSFEVDEKGNIKLFNTSKKRKPNGNPIVYRVNDCDFFKLLFLINRPK